MTLDNYTNPAVRQFKYDEENHLIEVYNSDGLLVSKYVYDAEGRRVRRVIGGQETWQVYGMGGELLAEYAATDPTVAKKEYGYRNGKLLVIWDGSETGNKQLQWLIQDHLGSTRMVVDRSGSLTGINRLDNLPYGEGLTAGIGIRSSSIGYGSDTIRQKFGSKERDFETGLDFFEARYFSSVQGRFTSVDPENAGADPELPQTYNGYSYSINNPLTYSDPDGLKVNICDINGNCSEISDDNARKYFFNKQYQNQSGYRIDGKGGVFDTGGNKIGTYQRTSFDDLSAQANAFLFGRGGMVDQAQALKPIVTGIGIGAAAAVALPTIGLATSGSGLTTFSLQGAKELLRYGSKQAAREAIERLGLSEAAKQAALRALSRGAATQTYQLIRQDDGGVVVRILRQGRNGYQVMEYIIDKAGNKQVIQKAVDSLGRLVHYDPKTP